MNEVEQYSWSAIPGIELLLHKCVLGGGREAHNAFFLFLPGIGLLQHGVEGTEMTSAGALTLLKR